MCLLLQLVSSLKVQGEALLLQFIGNHLCLWCGYICSETASLWFEFGYVQHIHRVGQNRVYVYMHRIWPYIWWFPCQKHGIYTIYAWFWPTLHIRSSMHSKIWSCVYSGHGHPAWRWKSMSLYKASDTVRTRHFLLVNDEVEPKASLWEWGVSFWSRIKWKFHCGTCLDLPHSSSFQRPVRVHTSVFLGKIPCQSTWKLLLDFQTRRNRQSTWNQDHQEWFWGCRRAPV